MTNTELASLNQQLAELRRDISEMRRFVGEIRQLVGPFGLTTADGMILTQTIHGQKYFLDPQDVIITPQMVIYRQWEADITALVLKLLTKGSVFIDVGANFGYFTCLAASTMGNQHGGRVYAVEPHPRLLSLLRRNVEMNWSSAPVTILNCAASDKPGVASLFAPRFHGANSSLSRMRVPDDAVDEITVRAMRLDDVIPRELAVDVLKIDVEGHELAVLQGANDVLGRSPNIKLIIEWSVRQMRSAGFEPVALREFLTERGFLPFGIAADPRALVPASALAWDAVIRTEYLNLLVARPT